MAENVLEFTDANFQSDVLDSEQLVVVDFWAPWCGPCKLLTPTIEELAADYAGTVRVGKMNTEDNPEVPTNFQVSAIPTVIVFKGGEIVDRFVGVTPKEKFASSLDSHLN